MLLTGPQGTNFSEMLIEIHTFSFKKIHLKMSSGKMAAILFQPQCVNTKRYARKRETTAIMKFVNLVADDCVLSFYGMKFNGI